VQRASVAKSSEGIVVQWKANLSSAYPREGGFVLLVLRFDDDLLGLSVTCKIKLSDYPELSVLPKDTPITITGRISRAERYDVEIEDAELIIHPVTS
jgi:hypothetical protein